MTWRATVLTIFPEMFPGPLGSSLAGKALADSKWALQVIDICDFAPKKHRSVDETLEVALRMLTMRRVLIQQGDGFAVSQRNRELVSYYANSIAHLIGPFSAAVVARDQLPAERFAAGVV